MINSFYNSQQRTFKKTLSRNSMLNLMSAMVLAWLLLSVTAVMTLKQFEQKNLYLQTLTLSNNLEAAIVFNDKEAINHTLNEFGKEEMFSNAKVININGKTLAEWGGEKSGYSLPLNIGWAQPQTLKHFVYHDKEVVGEVVIRGSGALLYHFLAQSVGVLTLCLCIIAIVSYLLARHLHRGLVSALQTITDVVHDIRTNRNFSRRIASDRIRGLHMFADDFNQLLDEIEQWQIQLHHENAQLWNTVRHDELTKLPNRSAFRDTINDVMQMKAQHANTALLFMDGNNFKFINDNYGHSVGDLVLIQTARRLESFAGVNHMAFRLNGDEFAMLLNGVSSIEDVENLINQLHVMVNKPITLEHNIISFSLSIGYALTKCSSSAEELFETADKNMYSKKTTGSRK